MAAFELKGRKVQMFRCHIDPMIPPGPKNAFMVGMNNILHAELTPAGVYAKTMKEGLEFLIPYANVQSIRLAPLEEKAVDKPKALAGEEKPKEEK